MTDTSFKVTKQGSFLANFVVHTFSYSVDDETDFDILDTAQKTLNIPIFFVCEKM